MTCLIANLSTGKGSWTQVLELMRSENWEKTFLVTNNFGKDNFRSDKKFEFILINQDAPIKEIRDSIISQLKGKIKDLEVAVNISSGPGKEHMALLSAVLTLGYGVRIVSAESGKLDVL